MTINNLGGGGIQTLLERRRMLMGANAGEDLSTWVKITFHLNNGSTSQYIVDGSANRVPNAALEAARIILDDAEITPTRQVAMTRGDHVVYYQIGDGGGYGWWYWVTNVTSIEIPANVTSLSSLAVTLAASTGPVMTFFGHAPFTSASTFTTFVTNRTIYVKEEYKQEYIDLGFSNVNTF